MDSANATIRELYNKAKGGKNFGKEDMQRLREAMAKHASTLSGPARAAFDKVSGLFWNAQQGKSFHSEDWSRFLASLEEAKNKAAKEAQSASTASAKPSAPAPTTLARQPSPVAERELQSLAWARLDLRLNYSAEIAA